MTAILRLFGSLAGASLLTALACSSDDPAGRGRQLPPSQTSPTPTTTAPPLPSNPSGGAGNIPVDISMTGGSGGTMICNELTIVPKPVVPTVLILVDNSSSMFEPEGKGPWGFLYDALMNTDLISSLQSRVRFGFASYKGNTEAQANEIDPACAKMEGVPYALDNFDEIKTLYTRLGTEWKPGTKWETPTGHAITRAAADLAAYVDDPPGPKAILLVTDGNPNTCQIIDPQCGQDLSVKAVQDAYAAGIQTFTIGIGEVIQGNVGCEPSWGRCGPLHLQDLANAGKGLPVLPPPEQFVWQNCADRYGRVLQGTYDAAATENAPYFTATNGTELRTAVEELLANVLSCTVSMNARVTGNAALGMVQVNGSSVTYNDPDGWKLEADNVSVTLTGAACEAFKSTGDLHIAFPCDPMGRPIVVPI